MRGEAEKSCLDFVIKQHITPENSFGLTQNDLHRVAEYLRSAEPNPNSSKFPDFVFDGGFIEHFQITSAAESEHGSQHKKDRSKFLCEIENHAENIDAIHEFPYSGHSYANLIISLKKNWQHHIDSLNKSQCASQCGIFLVEYTERALHMCEDILPGVDFGKGIAMGDFPRPQMYHDYRLSRDVDVLDYLQPFKEQIEFVIYRYSDGIEIIKLQNTPLIQQLVAWQYKIAPVYMREVSYKRQLFTSPVEDEGKK